MRILYALLVSTLLSVHLHASDIQTNKKTILDMGLEMSQMRDMLEAYIMVGAGITYKNPKERLIKGISHYEALLKEVASRHLDDEEIQESIKTSFQAWEPVKNAMNLAVSGADLQKLKEGAIFVHGNIRTVIKEMAYIKNHLLEISDLPNKEALNASIEIAASARRLSAHYMMDLWHLDDPTIERHWEKGLSIYAKSLDTLAHTSYMNNPTFKKLFLQCKKYHRYFTKMGKKAKIYSILIDKKSYIAYKKAKKMSEIILNSQ